MRPMAGLTSGKKTLLKTIAAASEESWKSMNSMAVPSQPETAALVRSRVVRSAAGDGSVVVVPSLVVIGELRCSGGESGRSPDFEPAGLQRGQPVRHGGGESGVVGQIRGPEYTQQRTD